MRIAGILTIIFLTISLQVLAFGQVTFVAKVVKTLDADTVDILHSDGMTDRVRMAAIDAPEIAHSKKEISQPFGDECKKFLRILIEGKTVTIEALKNRDLYGRVVGRILSADGEDINLTIVKNGCAWFLYPNGIDAHLRADYAKAFADAKANKIGLFARKRVTSPTVWRRRKHLQRPATKRINKTLGDIHYGNDTK